MKENVSAGFWIRFITKAFDLILVLGIFIPLILVFTNKVGDNRVFKEDYMFYIYFLIFILLTFLVFIVIPHFNKGQTIFMWLFRIKIINENKNKFWALIKREVFFAMFWILMALMIITFINHTMATKFLSVKQKEIKYTNWELVRRNCVISVGSVSLMIQFIFSISIIVRKNKQGLHDKFSKTRTVWKNKFIEHETKKQIQIKIKEIKNNPVEWV